MKAFRILLAVLLFIISASYVIASETGLNTGYDKINVIITISGELKRYQERYNIDDNKLYKIAKSKIESRTKLKLVTKGTPVLSLLLGASISPDNVCAILTQATILMKGSTEYSNKAGYVIVDNLFNLKLVPEEMATQTVSNQFNEAIDDFIDSYIKDSNLK